MKTMGLLMIMVVVGGMVWIMKQPNALVRPARKTAPTPPKIVYENVSEVSNGAGRAIVGSLFEGVSSLFSKGSSGGGYESEIGNLADGNPFSIGL